MGSQKDWVTTDMFPYEIISLDELEAGSLRAWTKKAAVKKNRGDI